MTSPAGSVVVDTPPLVTWAALCDGLSEGMEPVTGSPAEFDKSELVKGQKFLPGATYRFTRRDAADDGTPYDRVTLLELVQADPGQRVVWRKAEGEAGAHSVATHTWLLEPVSAGRGTLIQTPDDSSGGLFGCCLGGGGDMRVLNHLRRYIAGLDMKVLDQLQREVRSLPAPTSMSSMQ